MKKKKTVVSLWGDHIVVSSLFIGLSISLFFVALTFIILEVLSHYFPSIATQKQDLTYIFGIVSILVAFVINNLWIKPQRVIDEEKLCDESSEDSK